MENKPHIHVWITRYIIIHETDVASGMICECGEILRQDEVEDYVNKYSSLMAEVENLFLYGNGDDTPIGIIESDKK
jgi:hypothetical protein